MEDALPSLMALLDSSNFVQGSRNQWFHSHKWSTRMSFNLFAHHLEPGFGGLKHFVLPQLFFRFLNHSMHNLLQSFKYNSETV